MSGMIVAVLGLLFGLVTYLQLKNLPVHTAMREISELIYETCKTYLLTQGKFLMILGVFIGCIIVVYFGLLYQPAMSVLKVLIRDPLAGRHEYRHGSDQRRTADHALHPVVHSRRLRGSAGESRLFSFGSQPNSSLERDTRSAEQAGIESMF